MILTPTFHVHEMYLPHQGAKLVRSRIETPSYEVQEEGRKRRRDAVNVSASLKNNRLFLDRRERGPCPRTSNSR